MDGGRAPGRCAEDARLLGRIGAMFGHIDPVPDAVKAAARCALARRGAAVRPARPDGAEPLEKPPEMRAAAQNGYRDLWNAFTPVSEHCRNLLRVLALSPPENHAQTAAALRIPVGSVGPRLR